MRPETRHNLATALTAAEHVRRLAVPGWHEDETVSLAIERLLTIVGESILRIRNADSAVLDRLTDAHSVIGMRNVIVHGYDALDSGRIERAISEGLPRFIEELENLLG
ncbi:MAG: DUF86 domain-containing protein [Fimbriimonadaceae bacterium]|nr:DUF86 domain-containing protein [Fimbriimonadaceae bacterium]QYK57408.1 MAG: DUF86 domain-containing protein [Fimbriimonadaceae bacterium]